MLEIKTYTCRKCGKQFTKAVGGIVASPKELELAWNPVCDRCKLNAIKSIFQPQNEGKCWRGFI